MGNKSWELTEEEKRNQKIKLEEIFGEKNDSTIEEIIEGYKKLVQSLGGSFLEFTEKYNEALQVAKKYGFIESKLIARIKDFSSANSNTECKELDDMFGMEIATPTETEKETLILFNELIFQNHKSKIWNKLEELGGYSAYHTSGIVNIDNETNIKEKIIDILENKTSEEWTCPKDKQIEPENRKRATPFRNLKEITKQPVKLDLLVKTLQRMVNTITSSNLEYNKIPIIEFHFLTQEKQKNAIIGKASHNNYKNLIKEQQIQELFDNDRLYRGINAPWKFEANENGLKLQDFYVTLFQNWPFLEDSIKVRLNEQNVKNTIKRISECDKQLASQFPFLRKYINVDENEYNDPYKQAELWGKLKALIIHYRLDFNGSKKSLATEILNLENEGDR